MKKLFFKTRDGYDLPVYYYEGEENAPLIVEIHGGGYAYNKALQEEKLCRDIVSKTGANVASIDYRYYPEVTFPKATDDCLDAVYGLIESDLKFDRGRIIPFGHSAGANAAASIVQQYGGFYAQILDYPWLNLVRKYRKYVFRSFFPWDLGFSARRYFPNKEDRLNPLASPVFMSGDAVKKLPKTLVVICGLDTLQTDGEEYVSLLKTNGSNVERVYYKKAFHGFTEIISEGSLNKKAFMTKKEKALQIEYYGMLLEKIREFIK